MSSPLAVVNPNLLNLTIADALQFSKVVVGTGFLPAAINTPEKALAVIIKGQELRVPPMYALSNIAVVNGKPVCSAELMLALVKRDAGRDALHITETTDERCTVTYQDGSYTGTYSFTKQDAIAAGLWGKPGPWKQYPAAMLRARAISACCRFVFPDVLGGMYTPEELGADIEVDSDGQATIIEQSPANGHAPGPVLLDRVPLTPPTASPPPQPAQIAADVRAVTAAHTAVAERIAAAHPESGVGALTEDELDYLAGIEADIREHLPAGDLDAPAPPPAIDTPGAYPDDHPYANRPGYRAPGPADQVALAQYLERELHTTTAQVRAALSNTITLYMENYQLDGQAFLAWLRHWQATDEPPPGASGPWPWAPVSERQPSE